MLNDLNKEQLALENFMSNISENGFSAGWQKDLEFDLWTALVDGKRNYGFYTLTEEDINQLRSLSEECGCWIVFDDETEETAVDLESWKKMYADKKTRNY